MNFILDDFLKDQGWSFFSIVDRNTVEKALNRHKTIFEDWVSKNYVADMDYLENMKEDRFNPSNKLSSFKNVIVLGTWYKKSENNNKKNFKIADYANLRDYHRVLKKKLIKISDYLKSKNKNVETYISVDSGPMVDRVLAESAGLGFFGKNSCIINPSIGSFFFIASILTNVDLDISDKKQMPNCGNCSICINSCPTGALISPGLIDARKCISYLTIENKKGIDVALRDKIGDKLFGCDECQKNCPFNKTYLSKQKILMKELILKNNILDILKLEDILSISSDDEFLKFFAGTPIMRAKRFGLIRNACVVAGNSKDKKYLKYLLNIAKNENNKMLKEHAEWAIEKIGRFN